MLSQSLIQAKQQREKLPWNKARRTMMNFYAEHPRFEPYERPTPFRGAGSDRLLDMQSQLTSQLDATFEKFPEEMGGVDHDSSQFTYYADKIERDRIFDLNSYGNARGLRNARNVRSPKYAFSRTMVHRHPKHKSLQILPKQQGAPFSHMSSLAPNPQGSSNHQISVGIIDACGPVRLTSQTKESRFKGLNKTQTAFKKQVNQSINELNLTSSMFYNHTRRRRTGQEDVDGQDSHEQSQRSPEEQPGQLGKQLERYQSRSCMRGSKMPKSVQKAVPRKKKAARMGSTERANQKTAFQVLKSERCGAAPRGATKEADDSILLLMPERIVVIKESDSPITAQRAAAEQVQRTLKRAGARSDAEENASNSLAVEHILITPGRPTEMEGQKRAVPLVSKG